MDKQEIKEYGIFAYVANVIAIIAAPVLIIVYLIYFFVWVK